MCNCSASSSTPTCVPVVKGFYDKFEKCSGTWAFMCNKCGKTAEQAQQIQASNHPNPSRCCIKQRCGLWVYTPTNRVCTSLLQICSWPTFTHVSRWPHCICFCAGAPGDVSVFRKTSQVWTIVQTHQCLMSHCFKLKPILFQRQRTLGSRGLNASFLV